MKPFALIEVCVGVGVGVTSILSFLAPRLGWLWASFKKSSVPQFLHLWE